MVESSSYLAYMTNKYYLNQTIMKNAMVGRIGLFSNFADIFIGLYFLYNKHPPKFGL